MQYTVLVNRIQNMLSNQDTCTSNFENLSLSTGEISIDEIVDHNGEGVIRADSPLRETHQIRIGSIKLKNLEPIQAIVGGVTTNYLASLTLEISPKAIDAHGREMPMKSSPAYLKVKINNQTEYKITACSSDFSEDLGGPTEPLYSLADFFNSHAYPYYPESLECQLNLTAPDGSPMINSIILSFSSLSYSADGSNSLYYTSTFNGINSDKAFQVLYRYGGYYACYSDNGDCMILTCPPTLSTVGKRLQLF